MPKPENRRDWVCLEKELLEIGLSKRKTWAEIADFYDTTWSRVRYWLNEDRRNRERDREEYDKRYKRFIRHLDDYIEKTVNQGEVLTLRDLSRRLANVTEKDPKIKRRIYMQETTLGDKLESEYSELFEKEGDNFYKFLG